MEHEKMLQIQQQDGCRKTKSYDFADAMHIGGEMRKKRVYGKGKKGISYLSFLCRRHCKERKRKEKGGLDPERMESLCTQKVTTRGEWKTKGDAESINVYAYSCLPTE